MAEPGILVEELEKRFGTTSVLSGVNMRVEQSEVAVIIGGSGAGKTTLLRVLIGLERPTSGRVVVAGVDLAQLSERELNAARRKFGMVFQYSALLDSMNVLDNVAFPLREHSKLSEREIDRQRSIDLQNRRDLERLSARLVSAQEEERRVIARELHDEVGQALTAIKMELGVAQRDVRAASRHLGLRTWDKPAMACLASRIPYGTEVSVGLLSQLDRAEAALRRLGLRQVRVRHYDHTARLEVPLADFPAVIAQADEVVRAVRDQGYRYVTLDLEGFRSGNLNP